MKAEDLQKIFVNSRIDDKFKKTDQELIYFDGQDYLYINKDSITSKEELLIKALSQNIKMSEWHQFLFKKGSLSNRIEEDIQVIQIRFKYLHDHQKAWLETFINYFEHVYSYFIVDNLSAIVVIASEYLDYNEMHAYVSLLDEDFTTSTKIFIGSPTTIQEVQEIFNEELLMFSDTQEAHTVNYSKDFILHFYLYPQLKESAFALALKHRFARNEETQALIQAMWQEDGNISQAANHLYIHRNTLNYRLDRFYKENHLDLRSPHDLLIAHSVLFL